jgi:hypothetical protein
MKLLCGTIILIFVGVTGCTMMKPIKSVPVTTITPPSTIAIPFVDNNVSVPAPSSHDLHVIEHTSVMTAVLGVLLVVGILCFGPYIYHYFELLVIYVIDWWKSRNQPK